MCQSPLENVPLCVYLRPVNQIQTKYTPNTKLAIKIVPVGQNTCECGHTYNIYGLDDEPCPVCMAGTIDIDDLTEIEQARVAFLNDCFGNGKGSCIEDCDCE